jgi:hypothetical protein
MNHEPRSGASVKPVRKTVAVRRGLRKIIAIAVCEIDVSDSYDVKRYSKKERAELDRAIEWLRECAK